MLGPGCNLFFFYFVTLYSAYIFFVTSRGKKPINSLQWAFPYMILALLLVSGISVALAVVSYQGKFDINFLLLEVILVAICLAFVICTYIATCILLIRRIRSSADGEASPYMVKTRNWIVIKFLVILAAFILVWAWYLMNSLNYLIDGKKLALDAPSALMSVLDSVILGKNIFCTR